MANAHMGLLMLVALPLALLRQRSATENVLLAFGLVSLLASFGDALPVHRWLHSALPGLNVFRFPSYYTFFTLLCWLLPVAKTLAAWDALPARSHRAMKVGSAVIGVVLLLIVVRAALVQVPLGFAMDDEHSGLYVRMNAASTAERTPIHGTVQLSLIVGLMVLLWKRRLTLVRLGTMVALECMIAVMLCSWQTGIGEHSISHIAGIVAARLMGFPAGHEADGRTPRWWWRYRTAVAQYQCVPQATLARRLQQLLDKEHNALERDTPELFAHMKSKPLAYVAEDDGCARSVRAARLGPGQVSVDIDASCGPGMLIVQQQHLPGWRAWLDDTEVAITTVNGCAIGVPFQRGASHLELRYRLPQLTWLRTISWTSLAAVLVSLVLAVPVPRTRKAALVLVLAFIVLAALGLPWR